MGPEEKLENRKNVTSEMINVPEYNEYYPNIYAATDEQIKFFNYWYDELSKRNFLDLKGNISYIFVYLYSVIQEFIEDKDIDKFVERFDLIEEGYGNIKQVKEYLIIWKSDAYMFIGDFDKALEVRKEMGFWKVDIIKYAEIMHNREENYIDGHDLFCILGNKGITKFGLKYQKEIEELATAFLDEFFHKHKKTIVAYFIEEFNLSDLTNEDFENLKQFFKDESEFLGLREGYAKDKEREMILEEMGGRPSVYFRGYPAGLMEYIKVERKELIVPNIVLTAMRYEIQRILKEAENTFREEKDLPKIGEGWVSETDLYYKIDEAFPKHKVVHHGRPKWLGRQHLDIYFPEQNIGIEYQGDQHQNPSAYFGGEKGFKLQQKRDERKKERCRENNCELIFVYPEYNFEDVKKQVNRFLSN